MTEWIISSSILIVTMLLLRTVLRGKVTPRIQYALWAIVLLRLLMPFSLFQSTLSVQNIHEEVRERPAVQQVYQAMSTPIVPNPGRQPAVQLPAVPQSPQTNAPNSLPQQQPDSVPDAAPDAVEPQVSHTVSMGDVLILVWAAGIVAMTGWMTGCNIRFSRRLKRSRKELDVPDSLIPVYQTGAVETPCLFGLFDPAVYLTPEVAENDTLRNYVLTHELTHYRQFDHVWATLRATALVLHWYNPLVWMAFRASRQDGEMACDEGTLRQLGEEHRGNYGRTLIGLATGTRFRASMVTATSMGGTKRAMKERIVILMKNPKTAMMTMISLILVCVLIVGCTFTGAVEKPTEPEETTPVETTEPTETTEPVETTTPIETVPLDYTPLTSDQLDAANEAFVPHFFDVDGNIQVNPLNNFNQSYYRSPAEIDLHRFIYYFCYRGEFEDLDADFDLLAQKYPELEKWRNNYHMTRYPADAVDEILYKYTGFHIEDLYGTRDVEGVRYLAETDAYYSFSSDAGSMGLRFIDGRIFDDCVRLYTDMETVLTLIERDGEWFIQSYYPMSWDEPVELGPYQIDQVNKAFASTMKMETIYGTSVEAAPIASFFTSYYSDPTKIDLAEFLRYFSATGIVDDWYEDVTEEEFDYIRTLDGFAFPDITSPMDLHVPIHKYTSNVVDQVIYHYTGIPLDRLEDANGRGDAFYCAAYDSYYNFTSDFGPGSFHCVSGINYGSVVELYSENSVLVLQQGNDGRYYIHSHLPLEHHQDHEGGNHHD